MAIVFEFDLTLYRIDRDVYSYLDLIGDLGGLAEGIFLLLQIMLSLFTFYNFEHFLIGYLYGKYDCQTGSLVPLKPHKTKLCRQKCYSLLPNVCQSKKICCLGVCRLSREERLFSKARQRFNDEIDLVELLKNIRGILVF